MSNFDDKAVRAAEQGARPIFVQIFECNSSYCFKTSPLFVQERGYFVLVLSLLALNYLLDLCWQEIILSKEESPDYCWRFIYMKVLQKAVKKIARGFPQLLSTATVEDKDFEKIFRFLSVAWPSVANSNLFHNIHPHNDVGNY